MSGLPVSKAMSAHPYPHAMRWRLLPGYNSLMRTIIPPNGGAYSYAGTGYAQPNPVTIVHEVVIYGWTANVVQTLDYFPFGGLRISVSTSTNEKRKYIGHFYDAESSLSYLNARYYSPDRGQFISTDLTFLAIGDPNRLKQLTGLDQQTFLADPQQMNGTSYGRDNPINRNDPWGLFNLQTGTVGKGDTLGAITALLNKTYGTNYSVSNVASLNNIANANKIYVRT
jgi:RHS repeat-associated protein